jgi:hypothetical protein
MLCSNVSAAGHHNLGLHLLCASNRCIKIVNFEPDQDTIAVWFRIGVAYGPMIVLNFPAVQLEDEFAIHQETFIFRTTVRALKTKQALIPTTACLDITDANKRLSMHANCDGTLFPICL